MKVTIKGKMVRLADRQTRQGRLGAYETQGMMLELEREPRQQVWGTLFGSHIDTLGALQPRPGDELEVDCVFTTSERNGFVVNYVEFQNPRKS